MTNLYKKIIATLLCYCFFLTHATGAELTHVQALQLSLDSLLAKSLTDNSNDHRKLMNAVHQLFTKTVEQQPNTIIWLLLGTKLHAEQLTTKQLIKHFDLPATPLMNTQLEFIITKFFTSPSQAFDIEKLHLHVHDLYETLKKKAHEFKALLPRKNDKRLFKKRYLLLLLLLLGLSIGIGVGYYTYKKIFSKQAAMERELQRLKQQTQKKAEELTAVKEQLRKTQSVQQKAHYQQRFKALEKTIANLQEKSYGVDDALLALKNVTKTLHKNIDAVGKDLGENTQAIDECAALMEQNAQQTEDALQKCGNDLAEHIQELTLHVQRMRGYGKQLSDSIGTSAFSDLTETLGEHGVIGMIKNIGSNIRESRKASSKRASMKKMRQRART